MCSVHHGVAPAYNEEMCSVASPVSTTWSLQCLIVIVINDADRQMNKTVPQDSAPECGLPDLTERSLQ